VKLDQTTHRLQDGCFFPEKQAKDLLVLHFTSGYGAASSISGWNAVKNGVSTPYILDLDGTLYETYDPSLWSYHLGIPGSDSGNHKHDKRSIGLEIANIGPLKKIGNDLLCWPKNFTQRYCSASDKGSFVQKSYRGFDYYAAFTEAQKKAIPEAVKMICDKFGIPMVMPPKDKWLEFDLPYYSKWKGMSNHGNFRADKYDLGPALEYDEILAV